MLANVPIVFFFQFGGVASFNQIGWDAIDLQPMAKRLGRSLGNVITALQRGKNAVNLRTFRRFQKKKKLRPGRRGGGRGAVSCCWIFFFFFCFVAL